mmetsp:Transcript_10132/g.20112  ORF Transcript_10132/g.20112 Transcript_10132/m.20112 type:complete len:95 (-) Transcript_10132:172-456(-)
MCRRAWLFAMRGAEGGRGAACMMRSCRCRRFLEKCEDGGRWCSEYVSSRQSVIAKKMMMMTCVMAIWKEGGGIHGDVVGFVGGFGNKWSIFSNF